jgi:hypothetical protein
MARFVDSFDVGHGVAVDDMASLVQNELLWSNGSEPLALNSLDNGTSSAMMTMTEQKIDHSIDTASPPALIGIGSYDDTIPLPSLSSDSISQSPSPSPRKRGRPRVALASQMTPAVDGTAAASALLLSQPPPLMPNATLDNGKC